MSILFSHFFEKINRISPLESDFTEVLDAIALKPKTLYFYGKMPKNVVKSGAAGSKQKSLWGGTSSSSQRPKTVAIVGARHNTTYGQEVAYRLAYELGKRGVVVISGLAYGIDSIAHRGCLDAGGVTLAVLGTPIDRIYPRGHTALAAEIIEKGGVVISEYAPAEAKNWVKIASESPDERNSASGGPEATKAVPLAPGEYWDEAGRRRVTSKAAFLYRNRLISGLADAVVVVEAARRSGSLNTAAHALEQGKEVFAVPGNINNPYSQGCNRLIAEGAFPYTEPDDVLRVLFPADFAKKCRKMQKKGLIGDSDAETAVLKVLSAGINRGEEIMRKALLPPEVFNQTITLLELKSRVRSLGANNWALM